MVSSNHFYSISCESVNTAVLTQHMVNWTPHLFENEGLQKQGRPPYTKRYQVR